MNNELKSVNIVTTFDGSKARREDCRFIKGEFYIKNKQCFLINGIWYRINSGLIVYNHSTSSYVVLKEAPNLVEGVVGYDKEANELILGYFTPDVFSNVSLYVSSTTPCLLAMNEDILPAGYFTENLNGSGFRRKDISFSKDYDKITTTFNSHGYQIPVPYGVRHHNKSFIDNIRNLSEKYSSSKLNAEKYNIGNYLINHNIIPYSFGLEFETAYGKIPMYRLGQSGLIPLRDGSISGIEYATIPLSGSMGIKTLAEACNNLSKFTLHSTNESLHLHLGGIPENKNFIGSLYTILAILEKEVYSLFPAYYAQTSKFKARSKDYNMPLRKELVDGDPTTTFNNLAFYLSSGKKFSGFGKTHPNDPSDDHKWAIEQRYHWVNLIPTLFGEQKTVEFRVHPPTDDFIKIVNWMLICSSILKYTTMIVKSEKDLKSLKSLKLSEVISCVNDYKLTHYLNGYINARKELRHKMDQMSDYVGQSESKFKYKDLD